MFALSDYDLYDLKASRSNSLKINWKNILLEALCCKNNSQREIKYSWTFSINIKFENTFENRKNLFQEWRKWSKKMIPSYWILYLPLVIVADYQNKQSLVFEHSLLSSNSQTCVMSRKYLIVNEKRLSKMWEWNFI